MKTIAQSKSVTHVLCWCFFVGGAGVLLKRGLIFKSGDAEDTVHLMSLGFHGWCALGIRMARTTSGGKET